MDWQHLIMNGENLGEYAALLAAEGLLGHQHANSGWGTFDDDNMVGATAFMETLELALELRRANYGANGERLGFDLYPYTEDQVAAVKRAACCSGGFIDAVAGADRRAPRCARRSRARTPSRAYELVYAALGSADVRRVRRARRRHDRGQGARASPTTATVVGARASAATRSRTPRPGLGRAGPRGLVARERRQALAALGRRRRRRDRPVGPDARARRARRRRSRRCARRSSGTTSARGAECEEIEERVGLERLIALTGNRALTGFTAPKLLWLRDARARASTRAIAHVLLPKDYVRLRLCGERATDVADASGTLLFDVAARALERRRCSRRWSSTAAWLPRALESPEVSGATRDGVPVAAGARRPGAPARSASASTRPGGPVVGRARHLAASSSPRCRAYARRPAGARARVLPRGARRLARDGRDALAPPARCAGCATRSRRARRSTS